MNYGTSLQSIALAHELRAVSRNDVEPGTEGLMREIPQAEEDLTPTSGTGGKPLFVLGADNPDDASNPTYVI